MLNKNTYSGGGVALLEKMELRILPKIIGCLCILGTIGNAAEEQKYDPKLTRELYQHSYRSHLGLTWKNADIKANTWWKAEEYEESIFEVIPKAIADCMTNNAEFDGNNTALQQKYDIIEFRDATPDKVEYSHANWNALVLWNFVYRAMNSDVLSEANYQTIIDNTIAALRNYYQSATHNPEFKKNLITLNPEYENNIFGAGQDIKQYVCKNGVNLIEYINAIKAINKEERMCKAPMTRLVKDGIIASFPLNHPAVYLTYPTWIEYKIQYIDGNPVAEYSNYRSVPVHKIPEGIVEYAIDVKGKSNKQLFETNQCLFKVANETRFTQLLKNELPTKYSEIYKVLPQNKTKDQIDQDNIQYFKNELIGQYILDQSKYILPHSELSTMTATAAMNEILNKSANRVWETKEYIAIPYKDKLDDFRKAYNLKAKDYSDEQLLAALQKNNGDESKAFQYLIP